MTTETAAPRPPAVPPRPTEPTAPRIIKWVVTVVIIVPLIWAALGLEITWDRLLSAPSDIWKVLTGMFGPPDWSVWRRSIEKILESIYIAWLGTAIGSAFSLPLGFLAATNITPRSIATPARVLLSAIRAFPELILAVILIPAFGLTPFTGVLAIGIHSIGTLGKLTSEVIEGVDWGPVEAIQSSGGTKLLQMRFGVIPQAMPNIIAYWLYRFEINVRASAVIGLIGAGGIGAELIQRLRNRLDWPKAGTALIFTIVAVLIIDLISAAVRRRIISGEAGGGLGMRTWFFRTGGPAAPDQPARRT